MALELKLEQVLKEKDGTYTVYVKAVDSVTGKVKAKKCVQGKTKEEIKAALRPVWQQMRADYGAENNIRSIAETALAELEAES